MGMASNILLVMTQNQYSNTANMQCTVCFKPLVHLGHHWALTHFFIPEWGIEFFIWVPAWMPAALSRVHTHQREVYLIICMNSPSLDHRRFGVRFGAENWSEMNTVHSLPWNLCQCGLIDKAGPPTMCGARDWDLFKFIQIYFIQIKFKKWHYIEMENPLLSWFPFFLLVK